MGHFYFGLSSIYFTYHFLCKWQILLNSASTNKQLSKLHKVNMKSLELVQVPSTVATGALEELHGTNKTCMNTCAQTYTYAHICEP